MLQSLTPSFVDESTRRLSAEFEIGLGVPTEVLTLLEEAGHYQTSQHPAYRKVFKDSFCLCLSTGGKAIASVTARLFGTPNHLHFSSSSGTTQLACGESNLVLEISSVCVHHETDRRHGRGTSCMRELMRLLRGFTESFGERTAATVLLRSRRSLIKDFYPKSGVHELLKNKRTASEGNHAWHLISALTDQNVVPGGAVIPGGVPPIAAGAHVLSEGASCPTSPIYLYGTRPKRARAAGARRICFSPFCGDLLTTAGTFPPQALLNHHSRCRPRRPRCLRRRSCPRSCPRARRPARSTPR